MPSTPQTILGIDPGTTVMGFGVIRVEDRTCRLIEGDVVRLHKQPDHHRKLAAIHHELNRILTEFRPDAIAVEAPFYGKNAQSMLKLGRAQGVAITVGLVRGVPVFEYSPRKIKKAITGNGNASKEQVARMLQQLLGLDDLPASHDQSDAIATAICHHYELQHPVRTPGATHRSSARSGRGNWKDWLAANPDRLTGN